MPKGDWIWPALWLMPEEDKFGTWPRSGEIDVAECRGNERLYDSSGEPLGVQKVSSTLHFGPNPNRRNSTHFEKKLKSGTAADDFHVYGMQWSEGGFRFTLDGEVIGEMPAPPDGFWKLGGFDKNPGGPNLWPGSSMSPFDQKFFIILNVAVGGRFFPDDGRNEPHPRPWDWGSPGGSGARAPLRQFWERRDWWLGTWHGEDAALQVDYVKVFSN